MTVVDQGLSFAEFQMILSQAANICNDRPIGVISLTAADIQPITPNQLLIGRTSTVYNPTAEESEEADPGPDQLTDRQKFLDKLLTSWW